jgi:lipoprotein NlpI
MAYIGNSMMLSFRSLLLVFALLLAACSPTVKVAMPNEPININLNVKIQHEIYIKVDKQLDELFSDSSGLF